MVVRPLSEFLKAGALKGIYGFGDAEYVSGCFDRVERAARGIGVFESDGTKMDANIHSGFRGLEATICRRAFTLSCLESVMEIHEAQYEDSHIRTKRGNETKLYWSRRSGEGGTSLWNTIAMIFVFYRWLRSLGFDHIDAVCALGAYGGDDGFTPAYGSKESLLEVSDRLGLPLKVLYKTDSEPYSFLGLVRMPGIDLYVPDVVRFSSKIPFSHVKGVPAEQIMYRKCEPYVMMYPDMPLVGNLCRAVLRILRTRGFSVDPKYDELCRSGRGFVMTMLEGQKFPGPQNEAEYCIIEMYVCEALGLSLGKLREVCEAYDNALDFSQFPSGYLDSSNPFFDCAYEALIRDLYIPGQAVEKLVNHLPIEALLNPAIQNLPNGEEEECKESNTTGSQPSTTSVDSTCEESGRAKKKPSRRGRRKKKRPNSVKSGDGLPEDSSQSS